MERVVLSRELRSIGAGAFRDCGLVTLTLDMEVRLGAGAFEGCPLVKVDLGPAVELGNRAFAGCAMEVLSLWSTKVPDFCFEKCFKLKKVLLKQRTELGEGCFNGCKQLHEFTWSQVSSVGKRCFEDCGFTSLNISPKTLGAGAFQHCAALEHVRLSGLSRTAGSHLYSLIR